jgi:septal ring factor EnvC (AmiA/AmiB activator)
MRLRVRSLLVTSLTLAATIGLCTDRRLHAQLADASSSTGQLTERASERLRALQDEADHLAGEARGLLRQLHKLEMARQIANAAVREAQSAAEAAEAERDRVTADTARLEAVIAEERPRLATRLADIYKLGRGRYTRLLFSATDVRQFGRAARTVAAMDARDRQRVAAYESQLGDLQSARADLEASQQALMARRTRAAAAQAAAGRAVSAQAALIREVDERRDLNALLVSELQAAQQKLEATLAGPTATPPMALPIGPFRGALPWPTPGTPQARRTNLLTSQRPGVEILGEEAAAVAAIHDGVVVYAGSFEGFGNLVVIDHGAQTFSLYGHLLEVAAGRGAAVAAHEVIGRVGGSAGAATLYFELRVNGKPVDPLRWLAPQ